MNFLAAIRVRVYRGVGINILRVALAAMQHRILMIACSLSFSHYVLPNLDAFYPLT